MNYNFKSKVELYFAYYLEELKEAGYVIEWWYEKDTFELSPSISLPYKVVDKRSKDKIIDKSEHILHKASITADFTIEWSDKAENIFYLNPEKPIDRKVKDIPFRVNEGGLISLVEVKGSHEANTSSSISFPYKQKWLYSLYQLFIQKIRPHKNTIQSDILFQKTFTPKRVIKAERYIRDCKYGRKGESKLKYEYKTLSQFIN